MLEGIDVSHHNSVFGYSLTGRDFVIARASIGTAPDELFLEHIGRAKAAHKVTGAYHFNWSEISVASQVDAFIKASGAMTGFVDLYALDVEPDKIRDSHGTVVRIVPKFTHAQAREFIQRFEHTTGRPCGLYMSRSVFYFDVGAAWNWIADWDSTVPARADIWQYRGDPLDLDRFYGTRDELLRLGIPTAPDSGIGGDMAGLRLKWDITLPDGASGDPNPWNNLVRATLRSGSIRNAATGANVSLPAGTSLGIVQTGWFLGEAGGPAFDPPVAVYGFNNGNEQHIVPRSQCSIDETWDGAAVDTTPFDQADLDTATLSGRRAEWDRQSAGATVDLLARP